MIAFGDIHIRTLSGGEFSFHASFDMGFYCFFAEFTMNQYLQMEIKRIMKTS